MNDPAITGIVLAGGRSSRFGSADGRSKLDADLAGRSVLDRSIDALAGWCREVLVVGRPPGPTRASRFLADDAPFQGPLGGILVGLRAASAPRVIVVSGDSPLLHPEVLARLTAMLDAAGVDAAVLAEGDRWQPLPLALRREAARQVIEAAFDRGERSIRGAVGALHVAVCPEAVWRAIDPAGDTLVDVDTPEDLARVTERLASRPEPRPLKPEPSS